MEHYFPIFLIPARNPGATGNFPRLPVTLRVMLRGPRVCVFSKREANCPTFCDKSQNSKSSVLNVKPIAPVIA